MKLGTTHVHTRGHKEGDKLLIEETIKQAIKKKLPFIGITDHFPLPPNVTVLTPDAKKRDMFNEKYLKEFQRVKKKYEGKVEILFGVEFGWAKNTKKWFKEMYKRYDFDYLIGSVHGLLDKKGLYRSIDWSEEAYLAGIEAFGGIKKFVKEYYRLMREMIKSRIFQVVGHLDVVKVQNKTCPLFSEKDKWYIKEVLKTLNLIKKRKMCIEINGAGWDKRSKEQCPGFWIIKEAKKRNIPITLGSDRHYPKDVDKYLKRLAKLAKKAGYKEYVYFKDKKQVEVSF